jgi:hypothetical protein
LALLLPDDNGGLAAHLAGDFLLETSVLIEHFTTATAALY